MVWQDPSFLFQGQVMEQCYPQLARSTGHHHHSYWTVLLILVAVLEIQVLLPIFCQNISHKKIKYSQTILQFYVHSFRLWFQLY